MTRAEIAAMIAGVGLPYAYDHFDEVTLPPRICFLYPDSADFMADGANYQGITDLTIELYTDAPDFAHEAAIEAALGAAGLAYARTGPEYIREERMYMTTYDTSVLLTSAPPAPAADVETNDTEVLDQDGEQG